MKEVSTDPNRAETDHETALLLSIQKSRNQPAYEKLFQLMAPKIKSFLIHQGRSVDEAENIAQDAMLAVWRKAGLFNPDKSSARTWVYAIVRNRMIDLQRRAGREMRGKDKYRHESGVEDVSNGGVTDATSRDRLQRLLAELPEEQATTLVMSYVEGKSHKEIADEVGLPLGTVKSRIRIGFQRLQELVA
ncbi:MAG: sigma-70 family RNA polymerase sigma factor [Proteobacteria bacterium]|jgi:RNA polymerase sigma-70 factor (ECF subfamily)|nr:sigma-70 family RNA polymerase sigma factor [Pseudomonadota bacterium]MDA1300717.1 sigma-70 family RNA polymerase sigma factor [Pseudomonadota bacterium]